jgi:hypothetical protein
VRLRYRERLHRQRDRQPHSMEKTAQDPDVPADSYVSLDYQEQPGKIHCARSCWGNEKTEVPIHKGEPLALELTGHRGLRAQPYPSRSSPGEHAAEAMKLAVAICQSIRRRQNPEMKRG